MEQVFVNYTIGISFKQVSKMIGIYFPYDSPIQLSHSLNSIHLTFYVLFLLVIPYLLTNDRHSYDIPYLLIH